MPAKFAKDQPAGFVNRIEKVAIVGAGGSIGSYFTKHLLATGKHQITALARAGSTARIPDGVRRVVIDYNNESTLVEALKGQDFLVITLGVTAGRDGGNAEAKLITAAANAGVPYVMPNAYGPDPLNEKMLTQVLVGLPFIAAKGLVEKLGVSSWIALACGFWYEWSLVGMGQHRFGIDLAERTVTFFDDGAEKITTSTWEQCGRALAGLLSLKRLPDDENDKSPSVDNWANNAVYISSFRVNQKDMFESAKRVTGTADADWKIEYVNSGKRFEDSVEAMKKGDMLGFSRQMYTRIFFPTGEGDHTKHGLANEALGLPEEDIDESTEEGLRLEKTGVLVYAM
ncbi:NAD(P)-bd-dom domain-containing protein [Mycena indigotica]|uniref:NAD(P)-bd-dom domain-containing protein n=1 Tax=Mycena indigotica TaxID=2126181 RepID=A0A8H6WKY0_9AGAR|nr:NAD(P)-bd-dom domain-containing protein [Mycena indigotica]KAF7316224.1 NAD(P)-bd-dom domain-containing protein [Mycena indigotica]